MSVSKQRSNQRSNRMMSLIYKLSLKQRIWFSFVVLITTAIISTGSLSYFIAAKVVQSNAFAASQDNVDKAAQIIDDKLKNTGITIRSLMFSDAFKNVMTDVQNHDTTGYYKHLSSMQPVFSQVKFNDEIIQNILIASPIGTIYPINDYRLQPYSFYNSDLYERIKKEKRGFWTAAHPDPFFSGNERVLSLVVEGIQESYPNQSLDVYVVVNIKEKELLRLLNVSDSKSGRTYVLFDNEGKPVVNNAVPDDINIDGLGKLLADKRSDGTEGSFSYLLNKNNYLINYHQLTSVEGWTLYGLQPEAVLLEQMIGIQRTTLLIVAGFIFLSLLFSNLLTGLLLKPLIQLHALMKRVGENDLKVRFQSDYQDEIAQVGFRFNRMIDEIHRLIHDVTVGESEKRKAEMKALTAQIDPHFLYNTLNTIHCKSILGENRDVSEMILSLSEMFQLGLSGGKEWIGLDTELAHVTQYMNIQQKCYEGKFTFDIQVEEPDLLQIQVPRVLLQPLVENSILHGFRNYTTGGHVQIAIRRLGQAHIGITISDNGCGFQDQPSPITMDEKKANRGGFALPNIKKRLQISYGADAEFQIRSLPGEGTTVMLILPIREEVEGRYDETSGD
ncbi:cache domain-containing sensor histidine kinase [Paenibacillus roseipurpureus]|uniref:Histidine kinase n=1 Tax=Paenibacillus roseopurpureus TaxID=2918901 RepID=A0AA96LPG4_9BACL|nr:histidine kinase [Paenibacillus sp. MBLB1832]WNR45540.1 histidine kinase [Paenibacillus sp. MBLB1832]